MKRRTFLGATLAVVALSVSAASVALRAAVADICSKARPGRRAVKLPPLPKWNKTTDDIDTADFLRRSQDYERSLLPPDIIFPRTGQIWQAVRDCEVDFMAWIPKTFIPGGRARLQQGERVRILPLDDPKPIRVSFQPVRYHELHESIVPHDIRSCPGYQHYVLSLRTAYTVCCSREETGYFHELFRRFFRHYCG